jgi:acetylornithine deacetylase
LRVEGLEVRVERLRLMIQNQMIEKYTEEAVELLKRLIATPSVSRDETKAADVMEEAMRGYGFAPERIGNNLMIRSAEWDDSKPTILLNAHIDTVKPVSTWTRDPFTPTMEGDRLYGLGANDCGGGLVSLLQVFRILDSPLPPLLKRGEQCAPTNEGDSSSIAVNLSQRGEQCAPTNEGNSSPLSKRGAGGESNLIYLASCEEEVSGVNGIRAVLPQLPKIDVAIVGEPTGLQPAIAERGLMVIDATAHGKSGHAARNEGVNAIYEALDDLMFIRDYKFERVSPLLGPTKMPCTIVNSGTQHNVVPDECRFTIDVRTNELYTNEEVFEFLKTKLKSDIKARSFHLHSSSLYKRPSKSPLKGDFADEENGLIDGFREKFSELGLEPFGSPTLSDQALMRFPSFKLGPGESSRSHSADEFICVSEIRKAIEIYLELLA